MPDDTARDAVPGGATGRVRETGGHEGGEALAGDREAAPGRAAGEAPEAVRGREAAGEALAVARRREAAREALEVREGREGVREPETGGAAREVPAGAQAGLTPGGVQGSGGGSAREALARAQEALVAALVAGEEAPRGFDRERLRIQESSLISKRRRTVARLRPDLAALLGDGFAGEFDAYARGRPKPPGGSHADARDFADRLRAAGRLPEEPVTPEPGPAPRGWSLFGRRR
ncbi:hypothetical protein [Streptosporangium sp. V21-05]|uniref:hypothetical protein n=1 Tax=Streptosporangium sp. V21-05 TaxID=3446115 RepID=UPI003F53902B